MSFYSNSTRTFQTSIATAVAERILKTGSRFSVMSFRVFTTLGNSYMAFAEELLLFERFYKWLQSLKDALRPIKAMRFCCQECGKFFSKHRSLMPAHAEEKPHCCKKFGKRFSHWSMTLHMWTHSGENFVVTKRVEKDNRKSAALLRTWKYILDGNLAVAKYVEKYFPFPAAWRRTCEYTLEKSLTVAKFVEKVFHRPAAWPRTCEHTLGRNLTTASSVEKDFL